MKSSWVLVLFLTFLLQTLTVSQQPEPRPPPEENTEKDFLNFSVIQDPILRRYSEEFNSLCPHTHLCNVEIQYNASRFRYLPGGRKFEVPCCGSCYCGDDCLNSLDCCIDQLPRLLSIEEVRAVHANPAKCIYTQLRPFHEDKYNGIAYVLVSDCAQTFAGTVYKEKCQLEYSDFDFANDIPEYIPVTDNTTMVSYKNTYCALCNHISRANLIFWEVNVHCNGYINPNPNDTVQSLSDIEEFIERNAECNVVFTIPYDRPVIERCVPYINKCNVTGLWKEYDAELESLCASYFSSYGEYYNVHCYLCNGYDISSVTEICEEDSPSWRPSSFVTLMDFNNLESSEKENGVSTSKDVCKADQKYDVWAKTCRSLNCPVYMILSQGKCHPIFDVLNEATFYTTFGLLPLEDSIDVRLIPTLQDLLKDDVSLSISRLRSARAETCNVQVFIKLRENLTSIHKEYEDEKLFKEKVSYVAVRVLIYAKVIQNISATLEELDGLLKDLNFGLISGFLFRYMDINFEIVNQKLQEMKTRVEADTVSTIKNFYRNRYDRYRFHEVFVDPLDGLVILPVIPYSENLYPKSYRLSPFLFCPLITLSENEFQLEGSKNTVFLKHKGISINSSDVLYLQNSSLIMLCSDNYFSSQRDFSQGLLTPNPYLTEVILSIVCTCISLISLLVVFITYCSFKVLRTLPGLNNMALVTSLFFSQLFYLLGGAIEISYAWLCEAIGLLLHFSLVNFFFWMGICTFHMMTVFVFISNRSTSEKIGKVFIRYIFIATVSAVTLVCINVIVSVVSDSSDFGYGGQPCYITDKHMILYTVAIPLGFVITGNFIMFIYVIIKVSRLPDVKKNTKHERQNVIIFAKLSTLTGLTWIFAYIYQWSGVKAFAYLFILANASQGLLIMFSFVINKRVCSMLGALYKSSTLYKLSMKTNTTSDGKQTTNGFEQSEPKA